MALKAQGWIMAGSLLLALAQSAFAQSVVPGEVLEVPVSTHLLLTFHDETAGPWYLEDAPMSTRLLRAFRSGTAPFPGSLNPRPGTFLPFSVRPLYAVPGAITSTLPAMEPDPAAPLTPRTDGESMAH